MPKVKFTYDQECTQTIEAECDVPQEVVDQGEDAIRDYLEENAHAWDDGQTLETHFGNTKGKDDYAEIKVVDL